VSLACDSYAVLLVAAAGSLFSSAEAAVWPSEESILPGYIGWRIDSLVSIPGLLVNVYKFGRSP
jgi:hypothetical protein